MWAVCAPQIKNMNTVKQLSLHSSNSESDIPRAIAAWGNTRSRVRAPLPVARRFPPALRINGFLVVTERRHNTLLHLPFNHPSSYTPPHARAVAVRPESGWATGQYKPFYTGGSRAPFLTSCCSLMPDSAIWNHQPTARAIMSDSAVVDLYKVPCYRTSTLRH